jgi:hypothetical protein
MRADLSHVEKWRILNHADKFGGLWTSKRGDPFGVFLIKKASGTLLCVTSPGNAAMPWEHVSVSSYSRCPSWAEMAYVKSLFWGPDECVMQLHVPDAEHKSFHPYCLHLWRPTTAEIPRPPSIAVAP